MHRFIKSIKHRLPQNSFKKPSRLIPIIIAAISILFLLCTSCTLDPNAWMTMYFPEKGDAMVSLEWDPNPEPDLAGYRIYCGINSGEYVRVVDVGNTNSTTIPNLVSGSTYYFAATAYNYMGYESGFSTEICYNIPKS